MNSQKVIEEKEDLEVLENRVNKMNIKTKLENWVKETIGLENATLVHPKDLKNGDFTLIVNDSSAESDFNKLDQNKINEVEKINFVAPRFINIYLSKDFFGDSIEEIIKEKESFGKNDSLKGGEIVVEHTQPNPFKEFHIGHLMNNTIGESIHRILKASGAETHMVSYHGDKGLHVAKAVWAILKGEDFNIAYAKGNQAYEEDEGVKQQIIEINKKIYEKSDEAINKVYEEGRERSLNYFEEIYKRLGSPFEEHLFESVAGEVGKEIVKENVGKVFVESEGAVIFKGEDFVPKTHTRVFLNKEGLPTYEAKEVGLAKIKREKWPYYAKSITVTADEQDSFFGVVEVAIGEIFEELKGRLHHLSHGILKLPSGKMSSRTGNVITAESLIDQVKEKITEKLIDREFSEEEKEEIAEIVAIGAIKYSILRQAIGKDIIFDFEKSLSFEGDSGPYLQYTYVRAKSVLEKAGFVERVVKEGEAIDLERFLYRFPEVVERAAAEYAPHLLVTYLTELAAYFNSFYGSNKIIDPENPELSGSRLALTEAVSIVLKNGLNLLGIKVPQKM